MSRGGALLEGARRVSIEIYGRIRWCSYNRTLFFFFLFSLLSFSLHATETLTELYFALQSEKARGSATQQILHTVTPHYNVVLDSGRVVRDALYAQAMARLSLAYALHEQYAYNPSAQLCNKLISYYNEQQDTAHATSSLLLLSANYLQLGLLGDALPLILQAKLMASAAKDSLQELHSLQMLGQIYLLGGKYEASLVYTDEGIAYCQQSLSVRCERYLAELLCQQSQAYLALHRAQECIAPLQQGILLSDEHQLHKLRVKTRRLFGDVYLAQGRYPKAEQYYLEALYFSRLEHQHAERIAVLQQLSALRKAQERCDDALIYNDKALALADSLRLAGDLRDLLWQRYQFTREDAPEEALACLERYVALRDSLEYYVVQTKLDIQHDRYEQQLRDKQLEMQGLQIERDRYAKLFLVSGLVLLVAILLWVTHQRRKKIARLAQEALAKNRLFSLVSHDTKNYALSIQVALRQLAGLYHTMPEEQIREYLRELNNAADMQMEFLTNLLQWSRLQLNAVRYMPSTFVLAELLEQNLAASELALKNKELRGYVVGDKGACLCADRDMVDVIVRNLLSNAIKFSPRGGEVCLAVEYVRGGLRLTVTDHGAGMTPEQIQKIGLLEQRLLNTGTKGSQGAGLGLVLCQILAQRNGGKLGVDSAIGEGTRMSVTFAMKKRITTTRQQ